MAKELETMRKSLAEMSKGIETLEQQIDSGFQTLVEQEIEVSRHQRIVYERAAQVDRLVALCLDNGVRPECVNEDERRKIDKALFEAYDAMRKALAEISKKRATVNQARNALRTKRAGLIGLRERQYSLRENFTVASFEGRDHGDKYQVDLAKHQAEVVLHGRLKEWFDADMELIAEVDRSMARTPNRQINSGQPPDTN